MRLDQFDDTRRPYPNQPRNNFNPNMKKGSHTNHIPVVPVDLHVARHKSHQRNRSPKVDQDNQDRGRSSMDPSGEVSGDRSANKVSKNVFALKSQKTHKQPWTSGFKIRKLNSGILQSTDGIGERRNSGNSEDNLSERAATGEYYLTENSSMDELVKSSEFVYVRDETPNRFPPVVKEDNLDVDKLEHRKSRSRTKNEKQYLKEDNLNVMMAYHHTSSSRTKNEKQYLKEDNLNVKTPYHHKSSSLTKNEKHYLKEDNLNVKMPYHHKSSSRTKNEKQYLKKDNLNVKMSYHHKSSSSAKNEKQYLKEGNLNVETPCHQKSSSMEKKNHTTLSAKQNQTVKYTPGPKSRTHIRGTHPTRLLEGHTEEQLQYLPLPDHDRYLIVEKPIDNCPMCYAEFKPEKLIFDCKNFLLKTTCVNCQPESVVFMVLEQPKESNLVIVDEGNKKPVRKPHEEVNKKRKLNPKTFFPEILE